MNDDVERAVTAAFHDEWGRVVGAVIKASGDWELAEECAQEAFTRALSVWAREGVPRSPGAWLTTVARNRALDQLRRRSVEARKLSELAAAAVVDTTSTAVPPGEIPDDRLELIFTCCHPALLVDDRVALTLRAVAGLTTAEIARAFVVSESTMAKRLVRAKTKIRQAGIPFRVPPADQLEERTSEVLAVLYLLFNEGYAATSGPAMVRDTLSSEAIRLARLVSGLLPSATEPHGLLALMLFHDSRRVARVDEHGDVVTLADQDRRRWNAAMIEEATAHRAAAARRDDPGPYQLQAAIAECHCRATTAAATDWRRIAELYEQLAAMTPSPVIELNRAVAIAFADGPAAGLELVDALDRSAVLDDYHLLPATRADLLRRLGRDSEAAESYRRALALTSTDAERRYLTRRLAEVTHPS